MKVLLEIESPTIEKILKIIEYLEQKAKVKGVKMGKFTQNLKDVRESTQ